MYILKTSKSFDSAHFLSGYEGKCRNVHGHRWTVELEIKSEELEKEGQLRGMCVDFSTLKNELEVVTDYYDHSFIVENGSLKNETKEALLAEGFRLIEIDFRPTAENFAKHFYDIFDEKGFDVKCVTVYETPNNCASYCR